MTTRRVFKVVSALGAVALITTLAACGSSNDKKAAGPAPEQTTTATTAHKSSPTTVKAKGKAAPAAAPTTTVVTPAPTTDVTPAPSAPASYTGTVSRIDSTTIVLSDGRRIPTTQQTVVLVDDRAVMISKLEPGTQVVIYPNGQQAAVVGSQSVVTTPETRVITTPAVVPRSP